MVTEQRKKAEALLALHHTGKLLVLPNIWDLAGAKLLEREGFTAIATASASIAFSNGYNDGQEIEFDKVLNLLSSLCKATPLPVTADIEKGYAENNEKLAENIKKLIHCGVAGINIEDSIEKSKELFSVDEQCERIKVIRKAASEAGVPLVINARTDVFLPGDIEGDHLKEAITRGKSYKDAGADCFYPILCSNDDLKEINSRVGLPVNVLAQQHTLPMRELEKMGIARLSLGPSLFRAALSKMRDIVVSLKNYEDYGSFTGAEVLTSPEIVKMIKK